jgi:hypothetical protein
MKRSSSKLSKDSSGDSNVGVPPEYWNNTELKRQTDKYRNGETWLYPVTIEQCEEDGLVFHESIKRFLKTARSATSAGTTTTARVAFLRFDSSWEIL